MNKRAADYAINPDKYSLGGDYTFDEVESFGPTSEKAATSGNARAASSAIQTAASGGSGIDIASAGLMASGNPYALAAGTGLAVLSSAQKRKQQEEEMRAKLKMQRLERQQQALSRLVSIGDSMRRL